MDAWTVDDVAALLAGIQALRDVAVGLLIVQCVWFGWTVTATFGPSARELSIDAGGAQ